MPTTLILKNEVTHRRSIDQLKIDYSWPERCPDVSIYASLGSYEGQPIEWKQPEGLFEFNVTKEMGLLVELGSWLGASARKMLSLAPEATIICVDHWNGSPEHAERDEHQIMLPTLFSDFIGLNWEFRDRIIPLRMDAIDGLVLIHERGLNPDLIYIDASHDYDSVSAQVRTAWNFFPSAVLIGDDYIGFPGVRRAINHFMYENRFSVQFFGRGWRIHPVEHSDG